MSHKKLLLMVATAGIAVCSAAMAQVDLRHPDGPVLDPKILRLVVLTQSGGNSIPQQQTGPTFPYTPANPVVQLFVLGEEPIPPGADTPLLPAPMKSGLGVQLTQSIIEIPEGALPHLPVPESNPPLGPRSPQGT